MFALFAAVKSLSVSLPCALSAHQCGGYPMQCLGLLTYLVHKIMYTA